MSLSQRKGRGVGSEAGETRARYAVLQLLRFSCISTFTCPLLPTCREGWGRGDSIRSGGVDQHCYGHTHKFKDMCIPALDQGPLSAELR